MLKNDLHLQNNANAEEYFMPHNATLSELDQSKGLVGRVMTNKISGENKPINTSNGDNQGDDGDSETGVVTKTKAKTKKPNMYRVLLLNDDFTPMEFVILVLERFFRKTGDQATQIMLHVHNNGVGECGVFTYEVAETKVTQVMDFAKKNQHPLQCILEKQ